MKVNYELFKIIQFVLVLQAITLTLMWIWVDKDLWILTSKPMLTSWVLGVLGLSMNITKCKDTDDDDIIYGNKSEMQR